DGALAPHRLHQRAGGVAGDRPWNAAPLSGAGAGLRNRAMPRPLVDHAGGLHVLGHCRLLRRRRGLQFRVDRGGRHSMPRHAGPSRGLTDGPMITGKMHPVVRLSLHEIDNAMGPLRIEFRAESGEPGRIEITGDATGQRVFYVRRDPAGVTLFLDPSDPRHAGKALPHGGGLDPGGLSFLLQSSFCPFPSTPVADLDCIGAMDQVTLEAAPGLPRREVRRKFHFRAADSRQDQTPDPRRLLDLLCDATAECCEHPGPKVLMLSSGKDSVAIAAALSRLRRPDVECITFAAVPEDPEAQDAAAIAAEFKLRHRVVGFPRDPD